VGEQVRRGQALARLDATGAYNAVYEAEADLQARQAELKQIAAESDDAATRAAQTQAEAERLRTEADKFQSLYEQGALARLQAERAEQAAVTAEQAASRATRRVHALSQSLRAARARMAAQQSVLRRLQGAAGRVTLLRAPLDGRVVELGASVGDLVPAGDAVVRVADLSALEIDLPASLLKENSTSVNVGSRVPVLCDAADGPLTLAGVVTRRSARTGLQIRVDDSKSPRRLAPGLAVRVRLPGCPPEGQVLVPASALTIAHAATAPLPEGGAAVSHGDGTKTAADSALPAVTTEEGTLFVVRGAGSGTRVEERRVRLGTRAGGQVEVIEGVAAGERVVIRSDRPLTPGDIVRAPSTVQ